MSITIEARKQALSEFTGSPIEMIEDVNFENVFYDGVHAFDSEQERPLGFYLVLHESEKDYVKAIGGKNAIAKHDGFLIFITDKKGNVDLVLTDLTREIERGDEEHFKKFEVTFWNESANWKKESKTFRVAHQQDADRAVHDWAEKNGIEIDVIEIKTIN